MKISIKKVTRVTDALVQALERLAPQLSPLNTAPTRTKLRQIIDSPCSILLVAADIDNMNKIIGTLTLVVFFTPTDLRAWIEDVVVDAGARGKGVGDALCRCAIECAKSAGATTVDLTSRPSRQAANRLYERIGFRKRETNVYRLKL